MEIESSYVQEVAQVSKTKAVSAYTETNQEKNYNGYSSKEIRDIPYAEAKENYEEINKRMDTLRDEESSAYDRETFLAAQFQLGQVKYSDNDKLNETVYETMSSMESHAEVVVFSAELQTNLQDYYYGKDTTARFQINGTDGSNHVNKELNQSQLSNINMDAFIDKMLTTFTKDYENATEPSIKEQYKDIVDAYNSFKSNYDEAVTTPYYA